MPITSRARRSETAIAEGDASAEGSAPNGGIGESAGVLRKRQARFGDDGFGGSCSSRQRLTTDGAAGEVVAAPSLTAPQLPFGLAGSTIVEQRIADVQATGAQPPTSDDSEREALVAQQLPFGLAGSTIVAQRIADMQMAAAQPAAGDDSQRDALSLLALSESAMTAAGAAGRATPSPDIGGAAEDDADAPTEGQPAKRKPSTRRPPAPLSPTGVAAAVRAGMQSAGLAWLQAAGAADAATSTGGAHGGSRPATETETRGRADTDVPLRGEPPRYAREIVLPAPAGFHWPRFQFCAFYEHSGEEREAYARELGGAPTCSVADRRSILPPSDNAWHFIGTVQAFVESYPHSVHLQSNHVTCGSANWASWETWPGKILDGSMLKSCEELLWINCIGDRSCGEQPPTAHQHLIGPPTSIVNGHDFGAPSKTYYKWLRNLPRVAPTLKLDADKRWTELAAAGTPEEKTVKRSYTPRNMAEAEAASHAHAVGGDTSEFGRPASQPCRAYASWRAQLLHNFGLFAAHYAPTLSCAWMQREERSSAIVLIPIARSYAGACAMVPLDEQAMTFGGERDWARGGAEQGEALAAFITGGIETQYAAPLTCFGHKDAVVLLPWQRQPTHVLQSAAQRALAREAGLSAAWCTLGALHDHGAYRAVSLAFQRVTALTTVGAHGDQQAGTWETAKPLVHARTARAWARQPDKEATQTAAARDAFFAEEARRGEEMRRCLAAVDSGDGELVSMADSVKTADDYKAEIPFPSHGLPDFESSALRLQRFTERPLRLHTSWLARLPPQQVPPGFKPMPWTDILRGWARRRICGSLNDTADRDFDCWKHGESSLPRPKYVCIGLGGGKEIQHADGIGSYNALIIVYEQIEASGLYGAMDYQREGRTHWVLQLLKRIFGDHDDHYLMSLIMGGVRWNVTAPMQIRIAANLERLDSRIQGVGAAFAKLLKKGLYYKYKRLRREHERITPDGPGPLITIPAYIVGSGGTDKPDNPNEKRIIGDQSSPHPEQDVRECNEPHGKPNGPAIVSLNDMMGPAPGTVPRGQPLDPKRYPMPERESKPRPRQSYNDAAVVKHMAQLNGSYVAGFKDDGRHKFFQFEMAPEEERTCSFVVLIMLPRLRADGTVEYDAAGNMIMELWFVLIVATCMNMGSRNASKIAQRFTDRLLEGFSRMLDIYVRDTWLPKQRPALRELLAERADKLGPSQARPFATSGYTDDYCFLFIGPELLAAGALIWRSMCKAANFWLSDKACAGTILDYTGGRLVLNGGYGCLPQSKHTRAVADSVAAGAGRLTRDQLESHNSFMVHVHEWLDFPEGTLKGLSAPLKLPGAPDDLAVISPGVHDKFDTILGLLHTRNAASFWSGIDEATKMRGGGAEGVSFDGILFAPRFATDSCSDVPRPHIGGVAGGLFFRFPLNGEWRWRHITLTEGCGTQLAQMVFPPYFPKHQLMVEGDASAALAAATGTALAEDLIYMRKRAQQVPGFLAAEGRTWVTHCKGWANGLSDAASRDKMDEMYALADAYGMRLREVPIPPEAYAFMADVLANTTSTQEGGGQHDTSPGTHNLNMIGNMPIGHMEMREMLDRLDDALEGGKPPSEIARLANMIAARTGQQVAKQNTIKAIAAACRRICRPQEYPNSDGAARASGVDVRRCREWHAKITAALKAEDDARPQAAQPGGSSGVGGTSGCGGTSSADAGAAGGSSATASCAPDEMVALGGLLDMAQTPGRERSEAMPGPPPSAPPSAPSSSPPWLASRADHGTPNRRDEPRTPTGSYRVGGALGGLQREVGLDIGDGTVDLERELQSRDPFELVQWLDDGEPGPLAVEAGQPHGGAHSTARGRQNLNMIGDMPVAHGGASDDDSSPEPPQAPQRPRRAGSRVPPALLNGYRPPSAIPFGDAARAHEEAARVAVASLLADGDHDAAGGTAASPPASSNVAQGVARAADAPEAHGATRRWQLSDGRVYGATGVVVNGTHQWQDVRWIAAEDGGSTHDDRPRGWPPPVPLTQPQQASPASQAHDTARGRQNLNMTGDMPIAHGGAGDGSGSFAPEDEASPEPLMRPRAKQAARAQTEDDSPPGASSTPAQMVRPRRNEPAPSAGKVEKEGAAAHCATPSPGQQPPERRAADRGRKDASPSPVAALVAVRQSPRIIKSERTTAGFDDDVQAQPQRRRSTSPQPPTAAEARRRAALDTAKMLAEHDSAYALYPDSPELLTGVVISAAEARDAGIPNGTATADEWGFQWVRRFGVETGNLWMRPREVHRAVDVLCEIWFAIAALTWITQMIKPSARRRQAGYGQGMPTSALLAMYGYRRVMRDCGRYLPDLTETRGVLKGLCARYKQRWGDDAFVPARKQPFSTAHLLAIVAALTGAAGLLASWPAVLCNAVLTAFCYAISTGARKDEWTATFEGDTYVRRANFAWVDDDGADLPSTHATIASRSNGHLLRGRSAPSKCDRLNIEWGGRDMWFRLDDSNPLNFAWRWKQWELAHPCPTEERYRWPAFSPSGDATPFTGKRAEGCLSAVMSCAMTQAEAARRTWHSARITLATRLFARRGATRGASRGIARDEVEGVVQSLVRWKTPEAMRIYARMEPEQYADYVDMGTDVSHECGGEMPQDLPETDPSGVLADTEATVAAIEADAAQKTKAAKAAREGASAAAAGGRQGQRRAAPATGDVRRGVAEPATQQRTFEIDDGQTVAHRGDESWGIMGQTLRMHNSFWNWTDDNYSVCRVVGYAGNFRFASGKAAKHTYIIECEGFYYPATHTCVAGAMVDAGVKRRIRKPPPPRLL